MWSVPISLYSVLRSRRTALIFAIRAVDVYDPWVEPAQASEEYGIDMVNELKKGHYDAVILAVGHREFLDMGAVKIRELGRGDTVLYDIKSLLPKDSVDQRL